MLYTVWNLQPLQCATLWTDQGNLCPGRPSGLHRQHALDIPARLAGESRRPQTGRLSRPAHAAAAAQPAQPDQSQAGVHALWPGKGAGNSLHSRAIVWSVPFLVASCIYYYGVLYLLIFLQTKPNSIILVTFFFVWQIILLLWLPVQYVHDNDPINILHTHVIMAVTGRKQTSAQKE